MEGTMATIMIFAGNFAPRFWAFCQGQILSIAQNTALFSLLGTTYGGNGQTTFALPDLRGRTPIGTGQAPGLSLVSLGEAGGVQSITLTPANLPAHSHNGTVNIASSSNAASIDEPAGAIPGGVTAYASGATGVIPMGGFSAVAGNAGNSQPIGIRQPYLGVNFVICLSGIYPSRN